MDACCQLCVQHPDCYAFTFEGPDHYKHEQSIWDPSGNGTAGTAAQEEEKDEDKVAAMQAKYPEAKECVALVKLGLTAADTVS